MAPAFNISVPEDLHKEVNEINKYSKKIKISEVCQKALLEAVKEERTIEAESLAEIGAKRLMREIKGSQSPKDYYEECYQAGQDWAASEASLEELRAAFEYLRTDIDGNTVTGDYWALMNHFMGEGYIPGKVLKESMKSGSDSRLFQSFREGARDMWAQIKEALEKQGYNEIELKKEIADNNQKFIKANEDLRNEKNEKQEWELQIARKEIEINEENRKLEQKFITEKENFLDKLTQTLRSANEQEIQIELSVMKEELEEEITSTNEIWEAKKSFIHRLQENIDGISINEENRKLEHDFLTKNLEHSLIHRLQENEELEEEITSTNKIWEQRRALIHRLQENIDGISINEENRKLEQKFITEKENLDKLTQTLRSANEQEIQIELSVMKEELEKEITSTTKRWEKRRALIQRVQDNIISMQGEDGISINEENRKAIKKLLKRDTHVRKRKPII